MNRINFVYFAGNANWTEDFWRVYNGYAPGSVSAEGRRQYEYWLATNKRYYPAGDDFYNKFVRPDEHYMYIITPLYMELFETEMKRLDMWQYKIYESKEFAENSNYPGEARLKVFVFHTPKDFVHIPVGESK